MRIYKDSLGRGALERGHALGVGVKTSYYLGYFLGFDSRREPKFDRSRHFACDPEHNPLLKINIKARGRISTCLESPDSCQGIKYKPKQFIVFSSEARDSNAR